MLTTYQIALNTTLVFYFLQIWNFLNWILQIPVLLQILALTFYSRFLLLLSILITHDSRINRIWLHSGFKILLSVHLLWGLCSVTKKRHVGLHTQRVHIIVRISWKLFRRCISLRNTKRNLSVDFLNILLHSVFSLTAWFFLTFWRFLILF